LFRREAVTAVPAELDKENAVVRRLIADRLNAE
jgi:hypothetical protein